MRTLPIHLDRLAAALKAKGVTLKRNSLLEVAAAAFGHHNQNQLAAAAKDGDLEPAAVSAIGTVSIEGRTLVVLRDDADRPFAIDADVIGDRSGAFSISPYGGLVDLRTVGDTADLPDMGRDADAPLMNFASITHEYGSDLYCSRTEEGLRRQIADWCREYWKAEGVPGSYEGLSDEEVCEAYFGHAEGDGVTFYDPSDTKLHSPAATSRDKPYVPEYFDMRSEYMLSRMTGDADEPVLYWSSEDGWVDARSATVFDRPQTSWPLLGIDPGSLVIVPLPSRTKKDAYPNRNGRGLDIVFLTNRDCDVQGPEDRAAEALPWVEAEEVEVGLGPQRTAEIGYAALVDGEIYLAPTVKAFHFDAEDPVRAMMENRDELQEHADAIESAIKAVGGMAMIEEDTEATTLTVFIPLSEARRAPNMAAWKDALEDLLTPGGSGPRVHARFHPQVMMADGCYDAEALGDTRIDVTYEVKLMGEEGARMMHDTDDDAESLKEAIRSPDWISAWPGPFGIEVREAAAEYHCFDPEDMD